MTTKLFLSAFSRAFSNRPFQIAIMVIIVVLVIYFMGRRKGKELAERPKPIKIPANLTYDEGFDVIGFVALLEEDIYEVFGLRSSSLYEKLGVLPDGSMLQVYNEWNRKVFDRDKETLVMAINEEWSISASLRNKLIARFKNLGLK